MRIEKVECFPIVMPIREVYEMAGGVHDALRSMIVKVQTSDGIVGFGEAHVGVPGYSSETLDTMRAVLETIYIPAVLGMDVRDYQMLADRLEVARIGNHLAKCALEMATWDAVGKKSDQSVSTLLGGACRQRVGLAGGMGIIAPSAAAEKATALVEHGYRTIKVKIGSDYLEEDIARVGAVREAVGSGVAIRIDANGGYTATDALRVIRRLERFEPELVEQPVPGWDLDGLIRIRGAAAIPIMVDESMESYYDAYQLVSRGAADIVKIKIPKVGGFTNARRIITVCEAAGARVVVGHGMCTTIQALAEIHLVASSPTVLPTGEMTGPLKLLEDVVEEPLRVVDGFVQVPEGPGLGVDVLEEKLRQYAKR